VSAATIEMLERAAEALGSLADADVAFVGGATIALWGTDQAAAAFRPTDDVDVIVGVTSRVAYYRFEERLRGVGFVNDEESGLTCRFRHPGRHLILDAMPTNAAILGFENRWQKEAFPHAEAVELPSGRMIKAVPPTYLLATKLVVAELADLLGHRDFNPAGEGALAGGPETQARFERIVLPRIEAIVEGRSSARAHD
jgi:hypothetical protein